MMNTHVNQKPTESVEFDSRTIFPHHQYLLHPEDYALISARMRHWFYENTKRQFIDVPCVSYEQGIAGRGIYCKFVPMYATKFHKNAPLLKIISHNEEQLEAYAKNIERTMIAPLRRGIFEKYRLSQTLPNPVLVDTLPLPGFEFILEGKYKF